MGDSIILITLMAMKKLNQWALLLVFSSLAGCASAPSPSVAPHVNLQNSEWKLASLHGSTVRADPSVTLSFQAEGLLNGSDGCNSFDGAYTQGGHELLMKLGLSTLVYCGEPLQQQAEEFHEVLAATRAFTVVANELQLRNEQGDALARFVPLPILSLQYTSWVAGGINDSRGSVVTSALTSKATAIFSPAGTVSGFTGCNHFSGVYVVHGNTIQITAITVGKTVCPDGEQTEIEDQFLQALERSSTFHLREHSLDLRDSQGAQQVWFGTAP